MCPAPLTARSTAGYKAYPSTRPKSVQSVPGDGSDINIMTYTTGAVPNALDQNPGWQEVNRQVGANLKVNMTPFADYFGTKLQVTIAGGELPDLFFIIADPGITLVPEFFNAKVADLTPHVSGDAVKDYPNLAAIPTRAWKTTVFDSKIYGVPVPLRPYFWWYWVHQELLDQAGLKQPTNADELKQQLIQFTQPQQGVWGQGVEAGPIYAYGLWMGLFTSIFGAPNNWAVDTQRQVHRDVRNRPVQSRHGVRQGPVHRGHLPPGLQQLQHDQRARRVPGAQVCLPLRRPGDVRLAKAAGSTHPGAEHSDGQAVWRDRRTWQLLVRPAEFRLHRHAQDAVAGSHQDAAAGPELSSPRRLELRKTCCCGSASRTSSGPWTPMAARSSPTKARADFMPWRNIVAPAPVAYLPVSAPEFPTVLQQWEPQLAAVGVEDASVGFVSRTYAQKGATANRTLGDGFDDIVTGRRPLTDYDGLVKDWLATVGTTAKSRVRAGIRRGPEGIANACGGR